MMPQQPAEKTTRRFGCLQVLGLLVAACLVAAVATFFVVKLYLFPSAFKPVALTTSEEKVLARKMEGLASSQGDAGATKGNSDSRETGSADAPEALSPAPYTETGLVREMTFTEREINGLLAKNTDLGDKLAIDLSDDLISAKLRLPVDEDFPILGGKLLRLRSGVEVSFRNGRPVVILKGVTVMGVPVPNAWLGGIKNVDLVETFGDEAGFWKTFSDGIEEIQVEEGLLKVHLKE